MILEGELNWDVKIKCYYTTMVVNLLTGPIKSIQYRIMETPAVLTQHIQF